MNQRQWIPMEESTISKKRVIARISTVIIVVVALVVTIVGVVVGYPIPAVLVGVVVPVIIMRRVRQSGESRVIESMNTTTANEIDHARILNVVDGLCVVSGDHRPTILVVDSPFPIALATALPDSAGTIIFSTGFHEMMERVEVEGVMAHLLWRLRTGEAALTTFLLSLTSMLSRCGLSVAGRAIASRASDERVLLWADIAACQATRYPPALASALEKVASNSDHIAVNSAMPLWFAAPASSAGDTINGSGFSSLGIGHPSLQERIAILKEI